MPIYHLRCWTFSEGSVHIEWMELLFWKIFPILLVLLCKDCPFPNSSRFLFHPLFLLESTLFLSVAEFLTSHCTLSHFVYFFESCSNSCFLAKSKTLMFLIIWKIWFQSLVEGLVFLILYYLLELFYFGSCYQIVQSFCSMHLLNHLEHEQNFLVFHFTKN